MIAAMESSGMKQSSPFLWQSANTQPCTGAVRTLLWGSQEALAGTQPCSALTRQTPGLTEVSQKTPLLAGERPEDIQDDSVHVRPPPLHHAHADSCSLQPEHLLKAELTEMEIEIQEDCISHLIYRVLSPIMQEGKAITGTTSSLLISIFSQQPSPISSNCALQMSQSTKTRTPQSLPARAPKSN